MNISEKISMYESGELSYQEVIDLFQDLLDTGMVFSLQGHYGRVASHFLQVGLIRPSSPCAEYE